MFDLIILFGLVYLEKIGLKWVVVAGMVYEKVDTVEWVHSCS